jgi:hypothetical protein
VNYLAQTSVSVLSVEAQFRSPNATQQSLARVQWLAPTFYLSLVLVSAQVIHKVHICDGITEMFPSSTPQRILPTVVGNKTSIEGFVVPTGMTEYCYLMGCDVKHCSRNLVTFRSNLLY